LVVENFFDNRRSCFLLSFVHGLQVNNFARLNVKLKPQSQPLNRKLNYRCAQHNNQQIQQPNWIKFY